MTTVFTRQPIKTIKAYPWRLLTICIIFILSTCSCTSQEEILQPQDDETTHVEIDGFTVPQLPSSAEQLFFARASDAPLPRRIALFKAVAILFPDKRVQIGNAELEIAYLGLGTDFRRATLEQLRDTAKSYLLIATNYQDIPAVAAKALWYHGWITADLLKQKLYAMNSFLKIIESYPNQPISQSPFVSWTTINLEQNLGNPPPSSPQIPLTWSELAYLELVRHGQNAEICLGYYHSLIELSPESTLLFHALKLLAARNDLNPKILSVVKTEITRAGFQQILARELAGLLQKKRLEPRK